MSNTTLGSFIAGGAAACGAVTFTHPFETVKIRLQLQGELQKRSNAPRLYRGVFHGIPVILRNEGVTGLYRGLMCAYVYQVIANGCRLGFYEPMRKSLASLVFNDPKRQALSVNMFCGAMTGIIGAGLASPMFLVKTRLQSRSDVLPTGTQYNYKNARDGLAQIYKSEGVIGWTRGALPAMIRTGFGSSVQLPTYFYAKQWLQTYAHIPDGPALHLASSTMSGFIVCIFMHPPDTIMSRMYNQPGNLYRGAIDCIVRTVSTEGIFALYKGFFAHLARIGPHTVLTLTFAEQTNKVVRGTELFFTKKDNDGE